jgi:alkylation response protein AidB-like acyl-CoA dehydrogenase
VTHDGPLRMTMQTGDSVGDRVTDDSFRAEVRRWLAGVDLRPDVLPMRPSGSGGVGNNDEHTFVTRARAWQRVLHHAGWAGISWPAAYGGRGGTPLQELILREELEDVGATPSPIFHVGTAVVGPTMITHGTGAQRAAFLPKILTGEEIWCLLLSEPDAGSDLASVRTRAEWREGEWALTGQKVWTSGAQFSRWGLALVRTDPGSSRHKGLSCVVVDMRASGVDIRPLRQMTGVAEFNEVFLTDVRVAPHRVVGEVDRGWRTLMTALSNERTLMGIGKSWFPESELREMTRRFERGRDPTRRARMAAVISQLEIERFFDLQAQTVLGRGDDPSATSSLKKLLLAGFVRQASDLGLEMEGPFGMLSGEGAPAGGTLQARFLDAPHLRIAGGTDEIQRNIVAERILGLPPEPTGAGT